jgi:hypothetical protein
VCDQIADRWGFYATGWAGPVPAEGDAAFRRDLEAVLATAVPLAPALEAGVWRDGEGVLARSGGGTTRLDADIASAAAEAVTQDRAAVRGQDTPLGPVGIAACPLPGPVSGLAAYVAVAPPGAGASKVLLAALSVLLALMLAMTALVTWLQRAWGRHVRGIEAALADHESGDLPLLPRTGERELDRIIAALNVAGTRLADARQRAATLAAQVAQSERLAALGRVAAGVAHEIRNPIAAMRLRAENALAGDDGRRRTALDAILDQIARLDRLTGELLTMTQHRTPAPETIDLAKFLESCARDHPGVVVESPAGRSVRLDPALTRRALDSLLANARQHTPPGAPVVLAGAPAMPPGPSAPPTGAPLPPQDAAAVPSDPALVPPGAPGAGRLRITVRDAGPGVPDALRATLFEPFVTGRADGTGLGLSIARELVETQGGQLALEDPGGAGRGATFALTLPDPPTLPDPICPAS